MRKPLARCLAVALGLTPFAVLEIGLRIAGWPGCSPHHAADPLVGFAGTTPLFVTDERAETWTVDPARDNFFAPQSFAAEKPEGTLRVFCLGGSTVQGRPWSTPTAFPRLLELALVAGSDAPAGDVEVVNCGGISYASYRLVAVAEEILDHEPDLLVLCTGHNEFLEARSYPVRRELPAAVAAPLAALSRSATVTMLRDAFGLGQQGSDDKHRLPAEVDTMLDRLDGLADLDLSDAWRTTAVEHFAVSVERILRAADSRGVPVLLISPPARLRECPPFLGGRGARRAYAKALEADANRDFAAARRAYLDSKDLDAFPLRILEPMREALRDAAARHDTLWLDADALLSASCAQDIAGPERLVDHVHPTLRGHQEIALALAETLDRADIVALGDGWRPAAEAAFRRALEDCDSLYFSKATAVLDGLERWSRRRLEKLNR